MASGIQLKPAGAANSTFHVTAHGVGDLKIFEHARDKAEFLARLSQHLSPVPTTDAFRRPHVKLHDEVIALAYCVMDTHFHLMLHQITATGMSALMHRVLSSYGRYFNREHRRGRGPVFDGRYAARPLDESSSDHAKHMVAYIELNNPVLQFDNPFGSHVVIGGRQSSSWLEREKTLAIFGGRQGYRAYMNRRGPGLVSDKLSAWGIDPQLHPYRPI